ncbi:hypothetical protein GALL_486160 [mine drainage metagenome]|uniref:Uncharacterized protein n=1 Tax=mine drainage metagenome TaxID=410659 RepID=A0A1J5PWU0_9ZZZZ
MSSDDMSMNRLTRPSIQTVRGRRPDAAGGMGDVESAEDMEDVRRRSVTAEPLSAPRRRSVKRSLSAPR